MISGLSLFNVTFKECDMAGSKFESAKMESVHFAKSYLPSCSFPETWFRNYISWDSSTFNQGTNFDKTLFETSYPITNDESDKIKLKSIALDWSKVRFLSTVPLFEVSWLSFIVSLIIVDVIHTLNRKEFIETINYPIPIPENMSWIILSSILLATSTTIYRFRCPDIVQDFTQSQWVYEHKHARPLYLVKTLTKEKWRYLCLTLLFSGGFIATIILLLRLFKAIYYLYFPC